MRVLFAFFCFSLLSVPLALAQAPNALLDQDRFLRGYDSLLTLLLSEPSERRACAVYDRILNFQNASIDKEIVYRQRMHYADKETLRLIKTKDSLLQCLARAYERPPEQRQSLEILTKKAAEVEGAILVRLEKGEKYFRSLSVNFARQVYEKEASLGCLTCYAKIRIQRGNQKLADQLRGYAAKKVRRTLTWQQVQQELSANEVAIEFAVFLDEQSKTMKYAAFVLKQGYTAPKFIPLCDKTDLDKLLQPGKVDEEYYQQNLYNPEGDNAAPGLYAMIWAPLEALLANTRRIFYVPAGDLHRLNIAAIGTQGGGQVLQDKFEFVRINSTRGLIRENLASGDNQLASPTIKLPCLTKTKINNDFSARFFGGTAVDFYDPGKTQNKKDAALFGNIFFDMDSMAIRHPSRKQLNQKLPPTTTLKKRQWNAKNEWETLYGTKKEVDGIQQQLKKSKYQVKVYEGYGASEEAFKRLSKYKTSPRILHIATHGFFLADTTPLALDQPLNCAGLILAGANYSWTKGQPLNGMEDGILTAFEISIMRLQNTELVVLSACETGLGYIVNNEGVYGLQRAFKLAGVKNLLVSLWSVPDNATQMLMVAFYKNCLEKDMPIRAALQAAQQEMRASENYKNPFYWAGFILLE